jgi:hypothetical protein
MKSEELIYIKQEFSIENIKQHIKLVDNKPVIDKRWFYFFVLTNIKEEFTKQGVVPGEPISAAKAIINIFNIGENIRKIKVNLEYQERFKELLDKIDLKFDEINKNDELILNVNLLQKVLKSTVSKLADEYKDLCEKYYKEYEDSYSKMILQLKK